MEHTLSEKARAVNDLGLPKKTATVIGFDLEKKVVLYATDTPGVCEAVALTEDQITRLRAHWRWIAANPQGAA